MERFGAAATWVAPHTPGQATFADVSLPDDHFHHLESRREDLTIRCPDGSGQTRSWPSPGRRESASVSRAPLPPLTRPRIKSLVIFFGPILLPKAISYYRAARAAPRLRGLTVQPAPAPVRRALALLLAAAALLVVAALPPFAPENIFARTQSRLQIPTDVLFARLAALRPAGALAPADEALRARFVNLESRLLYLQYGPDALAACPFCAADDPRSYFYYALPALAAPHLLNLALLAAVTSPLLAGRHGPRWRATATLAAVGLALTDLYLVHGYNHQANARALRLAELDMFAWAARSRRLVGLAALDLLAAAALWLAGTNRAFGSPPSPAERVAGLGRALAAAKSRVNAAAVVKNTAMRDEELRAQALRYWAHEARVVRDAMEEREVLESVQDALQNRLDVDAMARDADGYASSVVQPLQAVAEAAARARSRDATPVG